MPSHCTGAVSCRANHKDCRAAPATPLQLGASLDDPTTSGYTPLSVAVCWEQREAASLLLELGADPNQVHCLPACLPACLPGCALAARLLACRQCWRSKVLHLARALQSGWPTPTRNCQAHPTYLPALPGYCGAGAAASHQRWLLPVLE